MIADLTCDSDGKLDRYPDARDIRQTLPVHAPRPGEDYLLGIFLVGAYQETLGDLHNLLGDTHIVSVRLTPEGGFELIKEIPGDSVATVLGYVGYDPRELEEDLRRRVAAEIQAGLLAPDAGQRVLDTFAASLGSYTYFEP